MGAGERENLEQRRKRIKGQTVFALSTGLICGFITGYLFMLSTSLFTYHTPCTLLDFYSIKNEPEESLSDRKNDKFVFRVDESVANKLKKEIRVLCWVLTSSDQHRKRAEHIKNTWGQRCTKLIFFSNVHDGKLPTVVLPEESGRNKYWNKTLGAIQYLYNNHYHDADWFIKADDTSYIILENLRYLLSFHKNEDALYIGCKYKHEIVQQGYMVDKGSYVLNNEALQKIAVMIIPHIYNLLPMPYLDFPVDVKLGYVLERTGTFTIDSRDVYGKERFHPFEPKQHVYEVISNSAEVKAWMSERYYPDPDPKEVSCCSETAISFNYMSPSQMYAMEYLVYFVRPYGLMRY